MHIHVRLGSMRSESRCLTASSHRVPLIANTTGVQHKRKFLIDAMHRRARRSRNEASFAIGVIEAAVLEKPSRAFVSLVLNGPLNGIQRVVFVAIDLAQSGDVERTLIVIGDSRQTCV